MLCRFNERIEQDVLTLLVHVAVIREQRFTRHAVRLRSRNGRNDIGLESTQHNQVVMYHMNSAMNVGCTHCHNSRYFPSYEVPAKYYSMQMLQMTQYINNEWGHTLGGNAPSCWMCHQEAVIPPGSAQGVEVVPEPINSESTYDLPEIFQMEPGDMDAVGDYADDMAPMDDMDMDEEEDTSTEMGMNTN